MAVLEPEGRLVIVMLCVEALEELALLVRVTCVQHRAHIIVDHDVSRPLQAHRVL